MIKSISSILMGVVFASALAFFVSSCDAGDDKKPSSVDDLFAVDVADSLIWNGTVRVGDTSGEVNTRILAWTAVGDDGSDGKASLYDIRYLKAADLKKWGYKNPANAFKYRWDDVRQLYGEKYPREAGDLEQMLLARMHYGETLWFALKAVDEIGQESGVSNVAGPIVVSPVSTTIRLRAGKQVPTFGATMFNAGDVNLDNTIDLIIGCPQRGKAVIIKGKKKAFIKQKNPNGINVLSATFERTPAMTVVGDAADEFAVSVAGLNRLDNNQKYDWAIGAPGFDDGANIDAGAVFLKFGKIEMPRTLDAMSVDHIIKGEAAGDRFGQSMCPILDINKDQRREFIVGAPNAYGTGAVYIFKSEGIKTVNKLTPWVTIKGESAGDGFGSLVTAIGDINGDGSFDFAVASPNAADGATLNAGAVYIFYGANAGVGKFVTKTGSKYTIDLALTKADVTIRGSFTNGMFGSDIAGGVNLSGITAGYVDLAVTGGDTVYVFFGGATSTVRFPRSGSAIEGRDTDASAVLTGLPGEEFGVSISSAGDWDRDGTGDLLVGAPGIDSVYLFTGPIFDGKAPEVTFTGDTGSRYGEEVVGEIDFNRDGYIDFAVGAPALGEAYVVF